MYKELEPLEGISSPKAEEFWNWVKRTFTVAYQDEIDSYLSQSTDHCDLERRMQTLARRGML